ncbi:MAG TPA: dihydrolipoamide acetyltransferase family protein [Opitutales bacterium]|jgi:pyruvate dehydrogenase E2 component (dihydrolipoamide acetyltransferase)|nr:dihydrolipoamide acetyltransferase family protein [Opitutales bacterium]
MAEIIEMPKLSDTMTVGTLVKWLKKEGDKVAPGDVLCEVETDKATMEVENFAAGVVLKHYVAAGAQIPIGAPMCAIGKPGEAAPAAPTVAPQAAAPAASKEPAAKPAVSAPKPETTAPKPATTVPQPAAAPAPAPTASGARVKASPLAKKLAEEKGVSLSGISGSGPSGRIVRADVLAAASQPKAAPASSGSSASAVTALTGPIGVDEAVPVSNMRSTIARRLLESTTGIPHFYVEIEIDAGPLADLREGLNAALGDLPAEKGGGKFTVNDFILKASVEALRRVPAVNSSWMGDTIQRHGRVHLAFGVALEDGLLTPVIRDADSKSLRQISAEAKALIAKARSKKLTPAEMSGSTFTVTNLGMFGVTGFYGIINPPNAGILSVGATITKPVVDARGQIVAGRRMIIGISGDHRVIDGAAAAQYLAALKSVLETPALLLLS